MSRILLSLSNDRDTAALVVVLNDQLSASTVEKVNQLCTGSVSFKQTEITRIIAPEYIIQGGDIPGENLYNSDDLNRFPENFDYIDRGILYLNNKDNQHTTEFFLSLADITKYGIEIELDKYVILGKVIKGLDKLDWLNDVAVDSTDRPLSRVWIDRCGELKKKVNSQEVKRIEEDSEKEKNVELVEESPIEVFSYDKDRDEKVSDQRKEWTRERGNGDKSEGSDYSRDRRYRDRSDRGSERYRHSERHDERGERGERNRHTHSERHSERDGERRGERHSERHSERDGERDGERHSERNNDHHRHRHSESDHSRSKDRSRNKRDYDADESYRRDRGEDHQRERQESRENDDRHRLDRSHTNSRRPREEDNKEQGSYLSGDTSYVYKPRQPWMDRDPTRLRSEFDNEKNKEESNVIRRGRGFQ